MVSVRGVWSDSCPPRQAGLPSCLCSQLEQILSGTTTSSMRLADLPCLHVYSRPCCCRGANPWADKKALYCSSWLYTTPFLSPSRHVAFMSPTIMGMWSAWALVRLAIARSMPMRSCLCSGSPPAGQ